MVRFKRSGENLRSLLCWASLTKWIVLSLEFVPFVPLNWQLEIFQTWSPKDGVSTYFISWKDLLSGGPLYQCTSWAISRNSRSWAADHYFWPYSVAISVFARADNLVVRSTFRKKGNIATRLKNVIYDFGFTTPTKGGSCLLPIDFNWIPLD